MIYVRRWVGSCKALSGYHRAGVALDYRSGPAQDRQPSVMRTLVARPLAALLVLLMAVGSVILWIGVPIGWLYIASHITKTSAPTLGPYLLVLIATPITMWIVGKLLFRLNALYSRLTGRSYEVRVQLPWHRSLRGERDSGHKPTVLEIVMIISVSLALLGFVVWFFAFAGSSIPSV